MYGLGTLVRSTRYSSEVLVLLAHVSATSLPTWKLGAFCQLAKTLGERSRPAIGGMPDRASKLGLATYGRLYDNVRSVIRPADAGTRGMAPFEQKALA